MIAISVGLLALGIYLWETSVPEYLGFYDTGVYLGASIHFVSGALPYRDFTFMQPPGIMLLMSPVAIYSRIFGSHDGFVLARLFSVCVASLNVSMIAWLVRHRGRMSMLIAGAGMALIPVGILMTTVVRLDLYSVFFVLAASLVVFKHPDDVGQLTNRQLTLAGALFGVAALVKLWAFFPFVALVVCLVPKYRLRVLIIVGAAGATFWAVCLPFLISAPRNFAEQVFVEQIFRKVTQEDSAGLIARLTTLSGLLPTTMIPSHREVIIITVVVIAFVGLAFWCRQQSERVDLYLLLASLLMVVALLSSAESYTYYGYYFAPFLLGLIAVAAARLGARLRRMIERVTISAAIWRFLKISTTVGLVGVIFAMSLYLTSLYSSFTWANAYYAPFLAPITTEIPAGSCVLYEQVAMGIETNRFQSSDPHCPNVVDPYGMWMSWGYMRIPPARKFVAEWQSYFESAQFVVLNSDSLEAFKRGVAPEVIPWDRHLITWFRAHYHLKFHQHYVYIYEKDQ